MIKNKQSFEFDFDTGMTLYNYLLHYNCYTQEFSFIPRDEIANHFGGASTRVIKGKDIGKLIKKIGKL